jgi:hypothetical protein
VALNRLLDPAMPGDALVIWGAGLGQHTSDDVTAFIGGLAVTPFYAGPAPGLPGVDQINLLLPEGVATRCFVPFVIQVAGQDSPVYTLSIGDARGLPCQAEITLDPAGLTALDQGGTIQLTVLSLLSKPDRSSQFAEAWVGEYDSALLSVLVNYDEPAPVAFGCVRRSYGYDRSNRLLGTLGMPAEFYGQRRFPERLAVNVTGPSNCPWGFNLNVDGVYRAASQAACPAGNYSIRDPGSISSAAGVFSAGVQLSYTTVDWQRSEGGAMVTWDNQGGNRLGVNVSSNFPLMGNIFNGLTYVRELNCRLFRSTGVGHIPKADLDWALGMPNNHSISWRMSNTSTLGGSWSSPTDALLIRTSEFVDAPIIPLLQNLAGRVNW